jgi:hypothetical protein
MRIVTTSPHQRRQAFRRRLVLSRDELVLFNRAAFPATHRVSITAPAVERAGVILGGLDANGILHVEARARTTRGAGFAVPAPPHPRGWQSDPTSRQPRRAVGSLCIPMTVPVSNVPSTPPAATPTVAEIARRRRRLGRSRPMLASLASVSQPGLARAERGLRELYPSEAERLSVVLDRIEAAAHEAVALRAASA